jgi:hypothetical protein
MPAAAILFLVVILLLAGVQVELQAMVQDLAVVRVAEGQLYQQPEEAGLVDKEQMVELAEAVIEGAVAAVRAPRVLLVQLELLVLVVLEEMVYLAL